LKNELKRALICGDVQGLEWSRMFQIELNKVNRFYSEEENILVRRLDDLESGFLVDEFTQFCRSLEVLRYYVVLNYIAVYKIVKKRNKMLTSSVDYLATLLEQPFYTSMKLARATVKAELMALKIVPEAPNEDNFACPICLDVLCNPVLLSCAHRFCWTCLSKTSVRLQSCPVCLKDQKLDPQNFAIDWLLMEFLNKQFPESLRRNHWQDGLKERLEKRFCDLQPKTTDCNYSLIKRLGEGEFGQVYLGANPSGEKFALKKISKISSKFKKSMIAREVRAGKLLDHPSIIKFEESFETASSFYLVMEYFGSQDLYSALEDRNFSPYCEEDAKKLFKQLVSALLHCHSKGIAHRDVKLENLLINKRGHIKLIDFGLCDYVFDSEKQLQFSVDGVGSPCYIGPEIMTKRPYNALKCDVWSSAVVLYSLLFGRFPFSSSQYEHLASGEPLQVQFPEIPVSELAKNLMTRMLSVNPETRIDLQEVEDHPWMQEELLSIVE